jgi:hypothetical protein
MTSPRIIQSKSLKWSKKLSSTLALNVVLKCSDLSHAKLTRIFFVREKLRLSAFRVISYSVGLFSEIHEIMYESEY